MSDMFKEPITSWLLKPLKDKIDSNDIKQREELLDAEHAMDALEPYIQLYTNLMKEHEMYKARMKKYEWIDNLLQSATRFLRHPLSKQHR